MPRLSLRAALTLTIVLLGGMGMAVAYFGSTVFRNLVYENKTAALLELLRLTSDSILRDTTQLGTELAMSVTQDKTLRTALQIGDTHALQATLDQSFHRYFVTAELLKLDKLYVFDVGHELLAASREGADGLADGHVACPDIITRAALRTGPEHLKPLSGVCADGGRPQLGVLVAVGGLRPIGYVYALLDPTPNLRALETELGLPTRILTDKATEAYRSEHWPARPSGAHFITAAADLVRASAGDPALTVQVVEEISYFDRKFTQARDVVLITSGLLLLGALLVAFVLLRRGIKDLRRLQIAADKLSAGEFVTLSDSLYTEVRDLTQAFNRMSVQIRMHQEHLGELVAIRTRELETANERLGRDIDKHRELDKLKDEFIGMVNHEMRTPVTAIKGALDLLLAATVTPLPEQARGLVQLGQRNCERLLRLLNDVLNIQQIAGGKFTYRMTPCAIAPLVEGAVKTITPYANTYQVCFQIENSYPDAIALVDAERFQQVLTNLLSNAAKYSTRGDAAIVRVSKHGARVRIAVTDHGPGIPESFRDQLFHKFSQGMPSNERRTGSNGLGLYIAKQMVDAMNGTIDFISEPGVETTFFIDLAAASAAPSVLEQSAGQSAL